MDIKEGGLVYQCIRISQELKSYRREIVIAEYRLAKFINQMSEEELDTLNSYLDKQSPRKTNKEILEEWREETGL